MTRDINSKKELAKDTAINKFTSNLPDIVIYLLSVIIVILIFSIWAQGNTTMKTSGISSGYEYQNNCLIKRDSNRFYLLKYVPVAVDTTKPPIIDTIPHDTIPTDTNKISLNYNKIKT